MQKSLFVTFYMILAAAIATSAIQSLIRTQDFLTWGGVLLTVLPFLAVLMWILVFKNIARTSARFPALVVMGLVGVIFAVRGYMLGGDPLAPTFAIVGFAGFLIYDYWYSSFDRAASLLRVGDILPEFELKDVAGASVTSSSMSDRPTVWIFYRGNWCPLCMAQIKEIVAQYQELEELGVRVALVSPQPHRFSQALARKFDVAFEYLTDEKNRAAKVLGIAHLHGLPAGMQALGYDSDTVLPTVIITGESGKILWVHETDNYRVRPEPETYLEVLRNSV
jgi:peroxiredoxin